jgi:DNA processing protein
MNYSENVINILVAKSYKGIGKAWIINNIRFCADFDKLIEALNKNSKENAYITINDFENRKKIIEDELWKLNHTIDGAIAIGDKGFPSFRGNVKSSEQPVVIFYRGNLSLLNKENKNIAVIGLLNPDEVIEKIEQEFVSELVKNEVTIVSGLALGCDSIAHRQALDSNGKTIAILPSSLDKILPATNTSLASKIVESSGLLITEYHKQANSKLELGSRYQERDRLQALFSNGIALVASYAKNDKGNDSGARLAMQYALNYSLPRAVIYDEKFDEANQMYDLNRQIISEDSKVTIIRRDNIPESVKTIVSKQPILKYNSPHQSSLLDYM